MKTLVVPTDELYVVYYRDSLGGIDTCLLEHGDALPLTYVTHESLADSDKAWAGYKERKGYVSYDDYIQLRAVELVKRGEMLPPEVNQRTKPDAARAWDAVLLLCGDPRGGR